jgi:hypothetical protein
VVVPELAKTGLVRVLGSNSALTLQVVPALRSVGGTIAAGNVIELDGTGLNPAELQVTIDGIGVGQFNVRTIAETNQYYSGYMAQQILTLTVPPGIGAGAISVSTAGGSAVIATGVPTTPLANLTPADDVGDTIATATTLALALNERQSVVASTANGTQQGRDVDLFGVTLAAGDELNILLGASSQPSHLRIFDAAGHELQTVYASAGTGAQYNAPVAGTYYVGISGYYNADYDPNTANSGTSTTASFTGSYSLSVERRSQGSTSLTGITTTAAQGTPASAGVPSANAGQTITITGSGFLATDQIVFQADYGSSYYSSGLASLSVAPTSVAADGKSMTVVVPDNATTGTVRLAREQSGAFLQVVPFITDVSMGNGATYVGGQMSITGKGFTASSETINFGNLSLVAAQNYYYNSNSQTYVTVPNGAPTGPISITTVGGSSNVLQRSFTGITATASSGTAANATKPSANPGQTITILGSGLSQSAGVVFQTIDYAGNKSDTIVNPLIVAADGKSAQVVVPDGAVTGTVRLVGDTANGAFALQIVPLITGVSSVSINGDGTANVTLIGRGFVEDNDSLYKFGSATIVDPGVSTGPDVYDGYQNSYIRNGVVTLRVALGSTSAGALSVTTAGGTSALFNKGITGVSATALSGTPADGTKPSANPGQAVTLTGTGLSTSSQVVVDYIDSGGTKRWVTLTPTDAKADGTSATLILPEYLNGVVTLQLFGSPQAPTLQIVPVVSSASSNGSITVYGRGFVEGATTFKIGSAAVTDTVTNSGPDIYYSTVDNGAAGLNGSDPVYGFNGVTVTTAGGTSAALAFNNLDPRLGNLGDVAVDSAGKLWAVSDANPAKLVRLEPTTGATLATITLDSATFGGTNSYYSGLQVIPSGFKLGATTLTTGSLLLFNGNAANDQVVAINPTTGAKLAALTLAGNYDLTGGVYDAATGHLFVVARNSGARIVEIDPTDGTEIKSFATPVGAGQSGLAIDSSGNLWFGSDNSGSVFKLDKTGKVLGQVDLGVQGLGSGITGLAFDASGKLLVSTNGGQVFKADVAFDAAIGKPTLTAITAAASNGTPAAAGASANPGQVITLTGTNFGPGTQVQFQMRDNPGNLGIIAVAPNTISADGKTLQVTVPGLAATGDVKVVNIAKQNLGYNGYADGIYRKVTLTFTPSSTTATLRFADDGLQGAGDESWGIDNVTVKQGATTVFQDDFEGAAKANWSSSAIAADAPGVFSTYSGRFSNGEQKLSLSGLTAGQTYTLTFDLYAIDSWDGSGVSSVGPDQFEVSANGTLLMREAFSSILGNVQTYNQSVGVKLQIVPTLTGVTGGRPAVNTTNTFTLQGSGFMAGASTIGIGGIAIAQPFTNQPNTYVNGGNTNSSYSLVAPITLDGPIRITTDGGFAEIPSTPFDSQPPALFTGIEANEAKGVAADPTKPYANAGDTITLLGQGFTANTLVQFTARDDTGKSGTVTRTGTPSSNGTRLDIVVPDLAVTGNVTVLGSNASVKLQVVPLIRSVGGTIAAGQAIAIDGTGFAAADLQFKIDGIAVTSYAVRSLIDQSSVNSGNTPQQIVTLTVPTGVSAGVITATSSGGSSRLARGVTPTALAGINPATDVGDTLASAAALTIGQNQSLTISSSTANGTQAGLDVDMYKLTVSAGDQLSLKLLSGSQFSYVRLFDAAGNEIGGQHATSGWTWQGAAPSAGTYYLGVSGYYNTDYDPATANSGAAGFYVGNYQLTVERHQQGDVSLTGITATAASGTPAKAGVPSANTGQTITLNGVGLTSAEQIVFLTDNNGYNGVGGLSTTTVAAASVAADGKSLTVVVPTNAATGTVRLAREQSGVFLQVVPTLSNLSIGNGSNYVGTQLSVTGSGLTASTVAVKFGGSSVTMPNYYYYSTNNTQTYVTVPNNAVSGPITITTAGGTSVPLDIALTGITATATGGTPSDATKPSANPGQTITLAGKGLTTTTEVIFQTVDADGTARQVIALPATAADDGTSATVVVPESAVTGNVRVLGSASATGVFLQIVPVISGVAINSDNTLTIAALGLVEGNTTYTIGNTTVPDVTAGGQGIDVYGNYDGNTYHPTGYARVPEPVHGTGPITVKTAGGTSTFAFSDIEPGLGGLGDVAVDKDTGATWVISGNGPAYVTQLDPLTGRVLKSFQLQSDAYGSTYFYYTGLQVASAAFTLNGTSVPKGSLLVFNGYAYPNDEVLAINPANGSLIARLQLGSNYDLTAGVFDAASGHLFVVARNSGTRVVEINPADGAEINSFATPFGAGQAGLAVDPTTGQLWYGSDNSSKLELLDNTGTSVKEVDLAAQGLATGVSGLAFDAGGNLLVSTTSGEVLVASTA